MTSSEFADRTEALIVSGQPDKALEQCRLWTARFPRDARAWSQSSRVRGILGDYQQALLDVERALKLAPRSAIPRVFRSEVLRRMGRCGEALADLDRGVELDPSYFLARAWRGRIHVMFGNFAKALADFDAALELEHTTPKLVRAWRAETHWRMGDCERAARGFDELFPSEPSLVWTKRLRDLEGVGVPTKAFWQDKTAAFDRDLDEVVTARPDDPWAHAFRGRCRATHGRLRDGLADLTVALTLDGRLDYAWRWRGECLRRLGAPRRALRDFDRALQLNPDDCRTLAFRAATRWDLGERDESQRDFRRACRPSSGALAAVPNCWWAERLLAAGKRRQARDRIRAALAADGRDSTVQRWAERLGLPS